ncbi:MAG TPA: GntR family transcriptional regulator [Pseudomonadales bacterium]|nr:GntR family transcriptional regulator [Pseudomonadales bacterium]
MSEFLIQTNSNVPIYRQLVDQVHRLAASGRLKAGDRLPSVRQLAEELAINPMTVSRAYGLLEQDGLVERRRGIGMVLRGDSQPRDALILPAIENLVRQAKQLGLDAAAITQQINRHWKDDNDA